MIAWWGLLASLVPMASAAPIQADLAEEAQLHFTLGLQAYKARQFPTALAHLLQSNRLAPNSNTAFNVALCYDRLAQPAQAWRFYAASLQQNENDRDAEAAMARLAPLIGRLSIDSDPPGARVFVERRDLGERGTTPLVLALRPGAHKILVERDGFVPVEFDRELAAGDADSVAVPLTRQEATSEGQWVRSTVRWDGEVVVQASPQGCTWLPDRGSLALDTQTPSGTPMPDPSEVPGSRLAINDDVRFALDVTVADGETLLTTRHGLRLGRPGLHLTEATSVRHWVLNACPAPGGDADRARVVATLQTLPKSLRRAVLAVLGETTPDAGVAASACAKGDCQAFVTAL
ncbi:MAG: PEGA domain-containing protein [Myxococcota bacterium]